jgi:L-threonylcarbamoyladenylate synthase
MVLPAADPRSFDALVRILSGGGVAIAPGDTMYGLIGIAPEAQARLRAVKGRGEDKPFLQLIGDAGWVGRFSDAVLPERIAGWWPGALTVVFPLRGGGTAALRVPDHPLLQHLLRRLDRPLYSTSVNRAGAPPLSTVADMKRELEADVDAIYDAGDQPPGAPSTLLDITRTPYVILRQGAVQLPDSDLGQ